MSLFRKNQQSSPGDDDEQARQDLQLQRLAMARKIALDSLKEDYHALEIDAKYSFGTAANLIR